MKIFYSKKGLEYCTGSLFGSPHPESPERVHGTYKFLKEKGFDFFEPTACSVEDLTLVHEESYVEKVKAKQLFDIHTPDLPDIYDYARLSAGSAIETMRSALLDEKAFSLMRPPGHHAGREGRALGAVSLGYCYFNNVAIACRKALENVDRVAIIDIDCHHGNGTQEIFLGDDRVLLVDLHRYGEDARERGGLFYPGTGGSSEDNCLNYPLRHGIGDTEYLTTLEKAVGNVKGFDPDLIAVSAGFDTHVGDPVGGLGLEKNSFLKIGSILGSIQRPTFTLLEGGYGIELPICIYNFLRGLEDVSQF